MIRTVMAIRRPLVDLTIWTLVHDFVQPEVVSPFVQLVAR